MITEKEGSIFDLPVDVIVHQANCYNTFGKGLALEVKKRFPAAYKADCATQRGYKSKLGTFSFAEEKDKLIVNLYSQYNYGSDKCYTDYTAMENGLNKILEWLDARGETNRVIGIPYRMGCGNAGGDWVKVQEILTRTFKNSKYNVIICKPKTKAISNNFVDL